MKLIIIERTQNNMSEILLSMEIEEFGTLKVELYPNIAPNTVSNFMNYGIKTSMMV